MDDLGKLKAAAAFALVPGISELNGGFELYKDKYRCLRTRFRKAERWWDSLEWIDKVEVGSASLHFHLMTANYPWVCNDTKFADIKKRQRKMIEFVFSKRNDRYSFFYLPGMLKL